MLVIPFSVSAKFALIAALLSAAAIWHGRVEATDIASRNHGTTTAAAAPSHRAGSAAPQTQRSRTAASNGLQAEARLIQVYQLIGKGRAREALALATKLVADHPNFALAQLVYGDLLLTQTQPIRALGDVPEAIHRAAPGVLTELRDESLLRIRALRERPAPGLVPANFIRLSKRNRHALAVDASRGRIYLFENTSEGLKLIADYYASVGKLGIDKQVEGDLKTPLGIYYLMSTLDPKSLKDFYGAGALPINYPNPYDLRRGKTGGGIWLHGVPHTEFARAPKSTDGCVALANPDLLDILKRVEIRTTPVIILPRLEWVNPAQSNGDVAAFERQFARWQAAKAAGDLERTMSHYMPDFDSYGKKLADWRSTIRSEMARKRSVEIKDVAILHWAETAQQASMVVTFAEVPAGSVSGPTKRQYWLRSPATQDQWKIFFEGVIG